MILLGMWNRACFVGSVASEGSFWVGNRSRAEAGINEDLAEVVWSAEVYNREFFQDTVGNGVL
jgi:hypothetical protein